MKQFPLTFALMKTATFAIPVVLFIDGLLGVLPFATPPSIHAALWWLAVVFAAYLLIPLFVNVQREFGMPFVDGANDNASGVTAMLGVLHNLVSEPEAGRFATSAVRADPQGG